MTNTMFYGLIGLIVTGILAGGFKLDAEREKEDLACKQAGGVPVRTRGQMTCFEPTAIKRIQT